MSLSNPFSSGGGQQPQPAYGASGPSAYRPGSGGGSFRSSRSSGHVVVRRSGPASIRPCFCPIIWPPPCRCNSSMIMEQRPRRQQGMDRDRGLPPGLPQMMGGSPVLGPLEIGIAAGISAVKSFSRLSLFSRTVRELHEKNSGGFFSSSSDSSSRAPSASCMKKTLAVSSSPPPTLLLPRPLH